MFEPVGGMDRIHAGFDRNLRRPAIRGAEVTQIRHTASGVDVTYRDTTSDVVQSVRADYIICTMEGGIQSAQMQVMALARRVAAQAALTPALNRRAA